MLLYKIFSNPLLLYILSKEASFDDFMKCGMNFYAMEYNTPSVPIDFNLLYFCFISHMLCYAVCCFMQITNLNNDTILFLTRKYHSLLRMDKKNTCF